MKIIGLIGGIASGKSLVAKELQRLGAKILNGDIAGHEVLNRPGILKQVATRFGKQVIAANRKADRKVIANIVFAQTPQGAEAKLFLESLLHPEIGNVLKERLGKFEHDSEALVVLDAALMLEAGWAELCDEIWFVDTPLAMRIEQAANRGWPERELLKREATQMSLDAKKIAATRIIDNSHSADDLRQKVHSLYKVVMAKG